MDDPTLGLAADRYDLIQQQLIPGYGSLARLAVALLAASPLASEPGAEVLVAGCGTGAELQEAVAQRPDWRLGAIDPSAAMLAEARSRLAGANSRLAGANSRLAEAPAIDWQQTTVEQLTEAPGYQGRYAGVLSVLVLQSLADDGSKLAFLSGLARSLRPGGQLVLVDLMSTSLPSLEGQLASAWVGFQRASGLQAPAEQLAPLTQGLHPVGMARLTSLVNAAGFSDPARIFQALAFEGFLLQKPS
ncbi:MAG: class I SAM-dependent methyltransferase [Cyanobacteria bacterium]|nr:class I SAM-dependent methyltransferase [Cyanobacteriota bacterium]PHX88482.1 MAG: SAM-dependent methyltransferase [Synechococcus sp. Baikal-G1]